jgi:hypothetical protein
MTELERRLDRAVIRFAIYREMIKRRKFGSYGASTADRLPWREPRETMFRLFRRALKARRSAFKSKSVEDKERATSDFEATVDAIAKADDWTRRMGAFMKQLDRQAKMALAELVRLGCPPDLLTDYVIQAGLKYPKEAEREWARNLITVKRLIRRFETLADECDAYDRVDYRFGFTTYPIGSQVGEWLRKRAATLRDFLAENNPHRKRADRWLVSMTHNVKRITGSYQDRLVALVLAATSPTGAENEEQLKKRRRRERIREWLDFLEMRRKHAAVETTGDIENG